MDRRRDDAVVLYRAVAVVADRRALGAGAAVAAHVQNPLLPWIGAIYVHNNSGADFVPATTNLNVTGLTTTFDIRAAYAPTSILTASYIGNENGDIIT